MKKRCFIRFVALACTVLQLTLLCACGNTGNSDNTTATQEISTNPTSPTATTFTPQYSVPTIADKDFSYTTSDLKPYLSLRQETYQNLPLSIRSDDTATTVEDVNQYLNYLQVFYAVCPDPNAKVTDVPAKRGDIVMITFVGTLDETGVAFDGGTATVLQQLILGSERYIAGFEEQLVGVVPKDTKENPINVHVTFPQDYDERSLAGKAATFAVTMEYLIPQNLLPLDTNFILDICEFQTDAKEEDEILKAFRDSVYEMLEDQRLSGFISEVADDIFEKLESASIFHQLPEELLHAEFLSLCDQTVARYQYAVSGVGAEDLISMEAFVKKYYNLTEELQQWQTYIVTLAEESVRQKLLLYQIARTQDLLLTEEEYQDLLAEYVFYYGRYYQYTEEDVLKYIGEDQIRTSGLYQKVMLYLLKHADITYLNPNSTTD